jgi:hypothetical protein
MAPTPTVDVPAVLLIGEQRLTEASGGKNVRLTLGG